jgi:hypothetical protein
MVEAGQVSGKHREKSETKKKSHHIIELQMVHQHHKTQKIKNLLLCRKAAGREGERNLGRAFCVSGRKQLFSLKSR